MISIEVLRRYPFFGRLGFEQLKALAMLAEEFSLKDGQVVIEEGKPADALFFLHAAKLGDRMNDQDRREKKRFVMFKYVINYADGQKAEVPVYSETDVENYVQKEPKPLPGGQVAWTMNYDKSEDKAVAYSKQWNNPRPDVEIKSVDMVSVEENRGTPVLLAITAAWAR